MRQVHGHSVPGIEVDDQTRCGHWKGQTDIIALRFKCCGQWYPCFACHESLAGHPAAVWPRDERDAKAILCGACGYELTITEYFGCGSACPACGAGFNPGCASHYHLYFDMG